jgi:hypothetical protein
VAPQKDFFYHTLVDMIDNYTAQHESQPDDVLQRKIADRVAVMKRTAERLRKLKDDSSSSASTSAAAAAGAPAGAASVGGANVVTAAGGAGVGAGAAFVGASPGPTTTARTKSKKARRTTAPVVVPSLARISPLSSSSVASRAAFDAKVAGLEDDDDGPSHDELKTSIVNALSPRSARLAAKQQRSSGGEDDDDGALVAPSRVVYEEIDFEVPPPPPLPGSLRRNAEGKLVINEEPPPPPLPDEGTASDGTAVASPQQPRTSPLVETMLPPPLPAEETDGAAGDSFTLPRMRPRPTPDAPPTPPLPNNALETSSSSPSLNSASPSQSPAPTSPGGSLPKPKSATLKKKRDTLRHSPPREAEDAKRSTRRGGAADQRRAAAAIARQVDVVGRVAVRRRNTLPALPPPPPPPPLPSGRYSRPKSSAAQDAPDAGRGLQWARRSRRWRPTTRGSNQMALAKAQAEYKELKDKIAEAQLRTSTPVVMTTPISGRPANAPLVKLMSSSSTNSVRQRTASIDEMTGHVADLKTAEEVGREEQLLALFGTHFAAAATAAAQGAGFRRRTRRSRAATRCARARTAPFDSSGSSTPHTTASPAPMPVDTKRSSADSVEERVGRRSARQQHARNVSAIDDAAGAHEAATGVERRRRRAPADRRAPAQAHVCGAGDSRDRGALRACLESMVENYKRELERSASTSARRRTARSRSRLRRRFAQCSRTRRRCSTRTACC